MSEESKIRDTAEALKGLAEAVPIYQDAIQPAAKEVGIALQTVVKTIHIALAPISVMVWGYEQIKDFVSTTLAEKLKNVPRENISTPSPHVAGPALEALKFTGFEDTLRDMYANLIATSMDTRISNHAHPAFVEIIKQLTPDEARIIRLFTKHRPFPLVTVRWWYKERRWERGGSVSLVNFSLLGFDAECQFPDLTPSYIDNLRRLGVIEVSDYKYTCPGVYDELENHPSVVAAKKQIQSDPDRVPDLVYRGAWLTQLGIQFCKACVIPQHDMTVTNNSEFS